MASGILGIALSGLSAAQAGIRTTQHNISNINTEGFRRQEVDYAALNPQFSGTAFFGSGVGVSTVRSLYSQFQDSQVLLNQGQLSRNETYATQASQIDKLVGDANSGLTSAMDAFFDAAQSVASDPTLDAARQVMLASGRNLAGRINTLDTVLKNIRDSSNDEIEATVSRINTYASQIAELSGSISRAEASTGQPANDLRDQRDQLVSELNKLINVTPVQQGDGAFSLFVGSGQPLVLGSSVSTMTSEADPANPGFDLPVLNMAGGVTQTLDSSMISGGSLGGLLAVREDVLKPSISELNRIAVAIGAEVNRVHHDGLQLDVSKAGEDFFSAVVQQTTGLSWVDVGFTSNSLANENYSVVYNAGTSDYTVTRLSDSAAITVAAGVEITLGVPGVAQGFKISPGVPAPAAGATWQLNFKDYARGMTMQLSSGNEIAAASSTAANPGPGDNTNMLAIAALRVGSTALNNDTFAPAYKSMIGSIATYASEADINVAAYETLTNQSKAAQQAISGVNLDEEASNLIRFQQAYQASAKAMQVASSLFDELIAILR